MYNKLLTISEAANMLGVSASTLRRMEKDGIVEGYGLKVIYTPGGQRRYILDDIQYLYSQQGFSGKIGFGDNPVILIRDLTRAFTDANSKLTIELKGQLEAAKLLIDEAKQMGIPVIFSRTIYDPKHAFSLLWGRKFSSLQVLEPGSEWIEIHSELSHYEFDMVVDTVYVSDFFASSLQDFLQQKNVDTLIIAGATTSGSLRATAIDAFQLGYHVVIPEEAVGDRNQAIQNMTLLDLNARYADVISVDQTIKYLTSK